MCTHVQKKKNFSEFSVQYIQYKVAILNRTTWKWQKNKKTTNHLKLNQPPWADCFIWLQ